jgi:hypothetical protein
MHVYSFAVGLRRLIDREPVGLGAAHLDLVARDIF